MPIINLMRYDPVIDKLEDEEDVLGLLRNVRANIGDINGVPIQEIKLSLRETLEIIREGKYVSEGRRDNEDNYILSCEVDLTSAKRLLEEAYACRRCSHYALSDHPGHIGHYCGRLENETAVDNELEMSATIAQFRDRGCNNRDVNIRPVEEIVEEIDR